MFGTLFAAVVNNFADLGFDHAVTSALAEECTSFVNKIEKREDKKEAKQLLKKLMLAAYTGVSEIIPQLAQSGRLTFNAAREQEIEELTQTLTHVNQVVFNKKRDRVKISCARAHSNDASGKARRRARLKNMSCAV